MKKIFLSVVFVLMLVFVSTSTASAIISSGASGGGGGSTISTSDSTSALIAKLQAMIVELVAQLNILLARQNNSGLALTASVDSYGEVNLKATFDPNKIDPISVTLRAVCPAGVFLYYGESGINLCNSDLNMDSVGSGAYKKIFKFHNSSNVSQKVDFKAFTNGNVNSTNYASASVIIPSDINTTATSTGRVSFVERPTLKLVYDSNKSESKLEAVATVYVDAGVNDLLLNYMGIYISDKDGRQSYTNARVTSFYAVSNAVKESVPTTYGSANNAWRVKAGTRAIFRVNSTENPQAMFAGAYTASLIEVGILNKTGDVVYGQLSFENSKSLPVTIIGEKSPYITNATVKSGSVTVVGNRLYTNSKVYVNGVYKGMLKIGYSEIGQQNVTGTFPTSWLDKTEKGGCSLYGNIQIEDPKYGKSNNFGVSEACEITSTQSHIYLYGPSNTSYNIGYNYDIQWGYSPESKDSTNTRYQILLEDENGAGQGTIADNVVGRHYLWSVGKVIMASDRGDLSLTVSPNKNYRIRVLNKATGSQDGDKTSGVFTITSGTTQPQAAANQLTKAVLELSYDSSRSEVALNASQQFSVIAGSNDIYVTNAGLKINVISGITVTPRSGWIPNGANVSFGGLSNTNQKYFVDSYGNNQLGWLVKAGQKANFVVKLNMNPQLMYSGAYTSELNYVGIYSNGSYGNAVMKGDSMPSNSVTIVGEKVIPPTGRLSPKVLYPNGGEILTLDKDTILITFTPVGVGSTHNINIVDSFGQAYQLATVAGEPTDKQAINVNTSIVKNYGLKDGKYKIEICEKSGCDLSDDYFYITSSTAVSDGDLGTQSCPATSSYTFTRNLTLGYTGDDVLRLKCFLLSKGYISSNYITSYFGATTKASLAAFQVSKGINPADGYFGPIVREIVNGELNTTTTPTSSISVLSPNGGEQIKTGERTTIKWTLVNPLKTVKINLNFSPIGYSYSNVQDTLSFNAPDTGSFTWVPSEFYLKAIVPGSFSVNVIGENSSDSSDRNFNIVQGGFAPRLSITSPLGGETFAPGQIVPVSWNQATLNSQYSLTVLKKGDDSVAKWDSLYHDSSGYKWTVPNLSSGEYYLKISDLSSNSNVGDIRGYIGYSNSFKIVTSTSRPAPVYVPGTSSTTAPVRTVSSPEARSVVLNSMAASLQAIKDMLKNL